MLEMLIRGPAQQVATGVSSERRHVRSCLYVHFDVARVRWYTAELRGKIMSNTCSVLKVLLFNAGPNTQGMTVYCNIINRFETASVYYSGIFFCGADKTRGCITEVPKATRCIRRRGEKAY